MPDPTLHGNHDRCAACELRRLIDYDPMTGVFRWKAREASDFVQPGKVTKWNARFAGQIAGCLAKSTGYWVITISDVQYYAHRLAWLLHYGQWPQGEVDHWNRDRSDNRIANLRDVSVAINAKNRRRAKDAGVVKTPHRTWSAWISTEEGRVHLGTFRCKTAALIERRRAERQHGYATLSDAEIVRRTCEEARRIYWPAFDARIGKGAAA